MNSTDIYILGAGGQARVILSIIQQTQVYKPLGVFDLSYSGNDEEIMGVPVLGGLGDLEGLIEKIMALTSRSLLGI
jgi:Predicted nucleoside-diphosphate sugar epimerases